MDVVLKAITHVDQYCDVLAIKHAFADWSNFPYAGRELFPMGVRTLNIKSTYYKNSADIELCLSLQEVMLTRDDIDVFFVIAGDRDYMPIAMRVMERAKEIYFISFEACIAKDLKQLVGEDHYIVIDATGRHVSRDAAASDDRVRGKVSGLSAPEAVVLRAAIDAIKNLGSTDGGMKVSTFLNEDLAREFPILTFQDRRNLFSALVEKGLFHVEQKEISEGHPFKVFTIGKSQAKQGPVASTPAIEEAGLKTDEVLALPKEEWTRIIDTIAACLLEGEGKALKGRQSIISAYFRRNRQVGQVAFEPRLERAALLLLTRHGVLVQKMDDVFHLAEDFITKRDAFMAWLETLPRVAPAQQVEEADTVVQSTSVDDPGESVTVTNELNEITLFKGQWIALVDVIERCLSDAGGTESFPNILNRLHQERKQGLLRFSPKLDIPLVNTLRFHGLLVQPQEGYYTLPPTFKATRDAFYEAFQVLP